MDAIHLKSIMATQPIAVDVDAPFSRVYELFTLHHIRHLPVVDKSGVLVGIITQRDLYRIYSPRVTIEGDRVYDKEEMDKFILKHVMTKDPLTMGPHQTLEEAVDTMLRTKYGCVPIVDGERRIIGIVTQIDLLRAVDTFYLKRNKGL